jgi:iron-sulfur cluster assembly protein
VKLSTPRRGCSGLAYSVDYVTEEKPFDEKIVTPAAPSTSTAARSST